MYSKLPLFIGITFIFISLLVIYISALNQSFILLIIAIILLLVSILFIFFITTLDLFRRDKTLDIDMLKQQGLHIVECIKCQKSNVLEDQYCIYCGEKLEENHE